MDNSLLKTPYSSQRIPPPSLSISSPTQLHYISPARHEIYFNENPLIVDPIILQVRFSSL